MPAVWVLLAGAPDLNGFLGYSPERRRLSFERDDAGDLNPRSVAHLWPFGSSAAGPTKPVR